jgi:hypothetical protein
MRIVSAECQSCTSRRRVGKIVTDCTEDIVELDEKRFCRYQTCLVCYNVGIVEILTRLALSK